VERLAEPVDKSGVDDTRSPGARQWSESSRRQYPLHRRWTQPGRWGCEAGDGRDPATL